MSCYTSRRFPGLMVYFSDSSIIFKADDSQSLPTKVLQTTRTPYSVHDYG